ncbi:response regulator transcription factor [Paenibacillus harenae]|uniref:Two-component system response regulator YesN n=1 Tax=Paenibacillus harenae TaxID=306543 RepID=A0ABT9UAE7_PAEHA|nr:helix-turn-helix domain-containing protein [Paenibacillus harenae]MDQ0115164.1 two-component system response regulator YesN [Paenibacillus harenae]
MTRLLLVDDEVHALEGIKAAVNWGRLGVTEVLTAFDIHQAKEFFTETVPVDVMLCDNEMPLGSGLELLGWVRERSPDTESIFLTCHADFHYAKQAIQLGSFDYLLKPVPIPELENVIAKAIDKKKQESKKSEYSQYGQYWIQHQPLLVERFWLDILNRSIPARPESIRQAAEERNIPFAEQMIFVPVLIEVKRWHKSFTVRDEKILEYALRNSAEELLLRLGSYGQLLPLNKGSLLAILSFEQWTEVEASRLRQNSDAFIRSCRQYFYCDLNVYVGLITRAHEMPSVVDRLQALDRNNVALDNKVLYLDGKQEARMIPFSEPELKDWAVLLREGDKEKLVSEITRYLEGPSIASGLDAKRLHHFHQDILQLVYSSLQSKGIQAHQLFSDDTSVEMSLRASRSVRDMIVWANHIIARSIEYMRAVERSETVVDRVAAYVVSQMDKSITRDEIAKHVYLNPDYLDRIFKKETGLSVTEFVYRERMTVAQRLLSNTNLPVHVIAIQVGFTNFSHFSRMFKKHTNCNPLEYRREEQTK